MTDKITTEEAIERVKKWKFINKDGCEDNGLKELVTEALKYREPRKPVLYGDGYADGNPVLDQWECDRCGYGGEVEGERPSFCPNCGQALDWDYVRED